MLQVAKARAWRSPDLTALIFFCLRQYQDQLYIGTFYRYWYVVALCYENITITIIPSRYPPTRSLYAPEFVSLVIIFRKIKRVYLIIGLRVYVTVCFSAVVGACVRHGVRPKRGGASDFLSGWSRPIPVVCSVSANFRQTQSCV